GAVHPLDSDGYARLVDHGGRHRDPHAPGVLVRPVHHLPRGLESDRADHRLVLPEEAGVEVDRVRMLDGDVDVLEDRVHGTDDLALLAVDAHVRINVELRGARSGVDAGDRADLDAGTVVGTQAGVDVWHGRVGDALAGRRGAGRVPCAVSCVVESRP